MQTTITDSVITHLLIEWKKKWPSFKKMVEINSSMDMNETRIRDAENIYICEQNDLLSGWFVPHGNILHFERRNMHSDCNSHFLLESMLNRAPLFSDYGWNPSYPFVNGCSDVSLWHKGHTFSVLCCSNSKDQNGSVCKHSKLMELKSGEFCDNYLDVTDSTVASSDAFKEHVT
jgi:hypothetical protein